MLLNGVTNANNTGLNGYWNTTNANSTVVYANGNGNAMHILINLAATTSCTTGSTSLAYRNLAPMKEMEDTGGDGPFVELGFRPAIILD